MLDDILSACLLRSGQKAVGDVLRTCLELVLELAVLAGDRYRGRLEEYQAALLLEDLWEKFRKKMLTLVRRVQCIKRPTPDIVTPDQGTQSISGARLRDVARGRSRRRGAVGEPFAFGWCNRELTRSRHPPGHSRLVDSSMTYVHASAHTADDMQSGKCHDIIPRTVHGE